MSQVKRIMISLPHALLEEVDGIAAVERLNRSRKRRLLREEMKKGYLEMAKINLDIAVEHHRLEAEVMHIYDKPVSEVK